MQFVSCATQTQNCLQNIVKQIFLRRSSGIDKLETTLNIWALDSCWYCRNVKCRWHQDAPAATVLIVTMEIVANRNDTTSTRHQKSHRKLDVKLIRGEPAPGRGRVVPFYSIENQPNAMASGPGDQLEEVRRVTAVENQGMWFEGQRIQPVNRLLAHCDV